MANLVQLRMLEDLNGFLLVDKPAGIPFSTVVKTVKRKFNLVKVGHGGSLDAYASGLMVLMINDANKFVGEVMGADREFTGRLKFGATTNTGEAHGEAMRVERTVGIAELKGDVLQAEPRYAAIRREGSAECEIVDTGDHQPLLVHIYRFDVTDGGEFTLKATKNVIPRALAIDMGATLTSLRRIRQWKFDVSQAIAFDKLLEIEIRDFQSCVIPLAKALQ